MNVFDDVYNKRKSLLTQILEQQLCPSSGESGKERMERDEVKRGKGKTMRGRRKPDSEKETEQNSSGCPLGYDITLFFTRTSKFDLRFKVLNQKLF